MNPRTIRLAIGPSLSCKSPSVTWTAPPSGGSRSHHGTSASGAPWSRVSAATDDAAVGSAEPPSAPVDDASELSSSILGFFRAEKPRLELHPVLVRHRLPVERRAVRDVVAVRVGHRAVEVRRAHRSNLRVLTVDRRVLAADKSARRELVPALRAVRLFVDSRKNGDLLSQPEVPQAHDLGIAIVLSVGPWLHVTHDRRREHRGGEPRSLVGARIDGGYGGRCGRGGGSRRWRRRCGGWAARWACAGLFALRQAGDKRKAQSQCTGNRGPATHDGSAREVSTYARRRRLTSFARPSFTRC